MILPVIATFGAICLGVIVITKFLLGFLLDTNITCDFCGHHDCKVWHRLNEDQQRRILAYFRSHERREPNTKQLVVCDECKTVFDDFSGKRGKPDASLVTFGWGPNSRSYSYFRTWCKVCNNMLLDCRTDNPRIHCRTCGSQYKWDIHEPSGYQYLMPPKHASLRSHNNDVSGSA